MRYGPPLQYAFVADRCILYITFSAVVFAERGGPFCAYGADVRQGAAVSGFTSPFSGALPEKIFCFICFFFK